jgi:hypothetical protein
MRAERHRQEAHEQRMEVLIGEMRVEAARARWLAMQRLNMAVGAFKSAVQAQVGSNAREQSTGSRPGSGRL